MSGVLYRCKEQGPLADAFQELTEELFEKEKIKVLVSSKEENKTLIKLNTFNNDYGLLNEKEKEELDELCKLWEDVNIQEIINYTRGQKPWMSCRMNEAIPYSLILQEDPNRVYIPTNV